MTKELPLPPCMVPHCTLPATKAKRVAGRNGSTRLIHMCATHHAKSVAGQKKGMKK